MGKKAFIGIGTNIGDRKENLIRTIKLLGKNGKTIIKKVSSIYETAPLGYLDQASFLNIVVEIETDLDPFELMVFTASIEKAMGRERIIKWGPRIIDLDILLYENEEIKTENLIIPHPRIEERAFVMVPLMEIAPEVLLNGLPLEKYINAIEGQEVKIWSKNL